MSSSLRLRLTILAIFLSLLASRAASAGEALLQVDVSGDYEEWCVCHHPPSCGSPLPQFQPTDCRVLQRQKLEGPSSYERDLWGPMQIPSIVRLETLSLDPVASPTPGGPLATSQVRVVFTQVGTLSVLGDPVSPFVGPDFAVYDTTRTLEWRVHFSEGLYGGTGTGAAPLQRLVASAGNGPPSYSFSLHIQAVDTFFDRYRGYFTIQGLPSPYVQPLFWPLNGYGTSRPLLRLGLPKEPSVKGPIPGKLVSALQTNTPTPNEVHEATLSLYEQPNGRLRPQGGSESDEDYEAFLLDRRGPLVARLAIQKSDTGGYTFSTPGVFRFDAIPAYRFGASEDDRGRGGEQLYYLLVVEGAATEEDPIGAGEDTTTVHFRQRVVPNFYPAQDPVDVVLDPTTGIGQKRSIAQRLSQLCPTNYGPVEAQVLSYLDDLEDATIPYTREREEGVLRAVWAERAARTGLQLGDELIELSLTGLATVLADAFDDIVEFQTDRLKQARRRLKKWEDGGGADPFSTGFSPSQVGDRRKATQLLEDRKLAGGSDDAKLVLELVKALKWATVPLVAEIAEQAGASPQHAEAVGEQVQLALESIANAVLAAGALTDGGFPGGLKPAIKAAIEALVPLLKNDVLDDPFPPAYCWTTSFFLDDVSGRMMGWGVDDRDQFVADRSVLVADLDSVSRHYGHAITIFSGALEVGKALDQAADIFEFLGRAHPYFKGAATGSKLAKYLTNASVAIEAAGEGLISLPLAVRRWALLAFGEPPSIGIDPFAGGGGGSGGSLGGGGSALGSAAANVTALRQALDALLGEVAGDQVGAAFARLTDEAAAALPALMDAWEGNASLFASQVAGIDAGGDRELVAATREFERARSDLLEVQGNLGVLLDEYAGGILALEFTGPGDPDYRATRDRLAAALVVTSSKIAALAGQISELDALLPGASGLPAVSVTTPSLGSAVTGDSVISASPESFTLSARVRNLGTVPLSNIAARLVVHPTGSSIAISGGSDRNVGTLAADDATPGSGADEAAVSWTFTFTGTPGPNPILLAVELLESGAAPVSFLAAGTQETLLANPELYDTDLDGLPNAYETANGLDPNVDDAVADGDGDGLSNQVERGLGTAPDHPDSDGDARNDLEERVAGADGFVTDPLDPDSDDDGTPDGADGAPRDAASTSPPAPLDEPEVAVDRIQVVLAAQTDVERIAVSNAGSGELAWTVVVDDPALVAVSPPPGEILYGPRNVFVTARDGFDFQALRSVATRVSILDTRGGTPDLQEVEVVLQAVPEPGAAGLAISACAALAALARRRLELSPPWR